MQLSFEPSLETDSRCSLATIVAFGRAASRSSRMSSRRRSEKHTPLVPTLLALDL